MVMAIGAVLTSVTKADLIGHWKFDEGAGTVLEDSSGNGHHATILGNAPTWGPGPLGLALDNKLAGGAEVPNFDITGGAGSCSLTFWLNWDGSEGTQHILTKSNGWDDTHMLQVEIKGRAVEPADRKDRLVWVHRGDTQMPLHLVPVDEWAHHGLAFDGDERTITSYFNGEPGVEASTGMGADIDSTVLIGIAQPMNRLLMAWIDDMQLHSGVLNHAEIVQAMAGGISPGIASSPLPQDGATDVPRDVRLSWAPGEFAPPVNGHVVYLGENFDDVNDATGGASQDANSFDPGRLAFGTTYYWRVDEVNGAPDFAVHKGDTLSFTTEPIAYPVGNVIATASSAHDLEMVATKTIDGSGLNAEDQHSAIGEDMWLSGTGDAQPWIQYEFAKAQKLHEMWVWNSNQSIEAFVGLGAKELSIETSTDGVTWMALADVPEIAQASGSAAYAHNTVVDFGGASAQYVKLTINAGWGQLGQFGLSEVRFFAIPVQAREPQPADGAAVDGVAVNFQWRAGRGAAQHEVVLSSDPAAVEDGSAVIATVSGNAFSPTSINYGTTYYWQINEVNDTELPARHAGAIWSFTTPDYLVVDDFESYDDDCDRIFFSWEDGFGHSGSEGLDGCAVPPSNGNGTGSIVGNAMAPFAETSLVHSGSQAMPVVYDNTGGAASSETTLSFVSAQDWTVGSPETLALYFYGDMGNSAGQLYVKINNAKVHFDGSPSALSTPFWSQWNIALGAVGADLSRVSTLTIGVEGAGAQGLVYVDSIRLYGQAPEPLVPQDPGSANLAAYYALENNVQDGSGNGHNGTVEGAATFVSPGSDGTGSCMEFGGTDERITVESFDVTGSGITLAAWIKPNLFTNDSRMVSKSEGSSTADHYWAMVLSGSGENNLQFRLRTDQGNTTSRTSSGHGLQVDEWTHVAVAWDADDPYQRMYKNGTQIYSRDKAGAAVAIGPGVKIGIGNQSISAGAENARPFDGLMDEVRIYSRGLSQAELLHVAFGQ